MATFTYKLNSIATATTAAAAALDIRNDGILRGVSWDISGRAAAGAVRITGELSFGSTSQIDTNDTTAVISQASGGAANAYGFGSQHYHAVDVPVQAGERLYLHLAVDGTAPTAARSTAVLTIEEGGAGSSRAPTRRR